MAQSIGEGPLVTLSGTGGLTPDRSQALSGTAFAADGSVGGLPGSAVEIDDNGAPVGAAVVAPDGTWTANIVLPTLGTNVLTATVTDPAGAAGTSAALSLDLEPVLSPPSAGSGPVDRRRLAYVGHDAALSAADGRDAFVFGPHPGHVTVAGLAMASHDDLLSFSHASFASIADLLSRTTQSGHDAVIHLSRADTVTLVGVGKAELRAHPGSFIFHA